MIAREVIVSPRARADLLDLAEWIAEAASPGAASAYLGRIEAYLHTFDLASERGRSRDDVRPGLRIVGFERRLSIAFVVQPRRVVILRIVYGGRDWTSELDERAERS